MCSTCTVATLLAHVTSCSLQVPMDSGHNNCWALHHAISYPCVDLGSCSRLALMPHGSLRESRADPASPVAFCWGSAWPTACDRQYFKLYMLLSAGLHLATPTGQRLHLQALASLPADLAVQTHRSSRASVVNLSLTSPQTRNPARALVT